VCIFISVFAERNQSFQNLTQWLRIGLIHILCSSYSVTPNRIWYPWKQNFWWIDEGKFGHRVSESVESTESKNITFFHTSGNACKFSHLNHCCLSIYLCR
jgi:hypothetical protein